MKHLTSILAVLLLNFVSMDIIADDRPGCGSSGGLALQILGSGGPIADGADILLMHMPVPEGITGTGRKLHAPPSIIGKIAAQTDAKKLVLSHFMARSLQNLEENFAEIRSQYSGPVVSAGDLDCIEF